MNKQNKISLKNGYTLTIDENDMVTLKVETEDDILEFDGREGNLMVASDMESWFDDEKAEMTYEEMLQYSVEFLTDWGVDTETAEAIGDDLKGWFKRYAISEEDAIRKDILKFETWAEVRRDQIKDSMRRITECRNEIRAFEERIGYEVSQIEKLNEDIEDLTKRIAELNAKLK